MKKHFLRNQRQRIAMGLTIAVACSMLPAGITHAEETTETANQEVQQQDSNGDERQIISEYIYQLGMNFIDEVKKEAVNQEETSASDEKMEEGNSESLIDPALLNISYPEQFSLTNVNGKNYVSPVKQQNPWGTCWAFATIAAAETSIMYELDMPVTPENPDPLNLSEKQVAWFSYVPVPAGEENHQDGEGIWCVDTETGKLSRDANVIYHQGGRVVQAAKVFSSGIGPVVEREVPYGPVEQNSENAVAYTVFDENGNSFHWNTEGDWSVPEDKRNIYSYTLQNTHKLPSSANNNPEGVLSMKKELLEGRPIWIAYYADVYEPNQMDNTEKGTYIYKNEQGLCSQYTYEDENPDHAVTVVGYDDHYSKDNFLEGHKPAGDGAWLVKNSWGTSSDKGAFPNILPPKISFGNNGDGYFWLSYYDKTIGYEQTLDFDLSKEELDADGKVICEYDYLPSAFDQSIGMPVTSSYANVFTTHEKEILSDVGIFSQSANSKITVAVYKLDDDSKSPSDGKLIDTTEVSYPYAGYHKFPLSKKHNLRLGQKYSVVVTEEQEDGTTMIPINMDLDYNLTAYFNSMQNKMALKHFAVGVVNPLESYVCVNGVWSDFADAIKTGKAKIEAETGFPGGVLAIDNFTIKTYGREIK